MHEQRGGRGWYHEESVEIDGARERGWKERKRETKRERPLFVWKEDLKHVVPLYTRIVRGSSLGKIKKKTVYWRNGDSGRVGWCAGSREKNDALRETKEDGRRTRASSRLAGREGERHPLPAARVLYCFCVQSKWERNGAADGGCRRTAVRARGTAIGYWKSVFL